MLTPQTNQLGPPAETASGPGGEVRLPRPFTATLKALLCIALFAQMFPTSSQASHTPRKAKLSPDRAQQYLAGGTRWLDSRHDEVVHFICQGGTPYTISLDSASLRTARIPTADHPRFLGALREAVADWSALMGCHRFRVELDSPYPNTRIYFTPIDAPGTLATATRAGDITLNLRRDWFPGSKHHGNYGPRNRLVSFYWVVAHELGHVWGLAHSDSPDSLMYPSQCRTCRWSSFEQAAGNVIRASSQTPAWSRPHYANRFFAKTPRAVVGRLLKGDLPAEPDLAVAESCGTQTCAAHPATPDRPLSDGCDAPDSANTAAVLGWQLFRLPEALANGRSSRWERRAKGAHRRPRPQGQNTPTWPMLDSPAAVLPLFDPGRQRWSLLGSC